MKFVTWNVRRSTDDKKCWEIFSALNPDIAVLQEVGKLPTYLEEKYRCIFKIPKSKTSKNQKFSTYILTNGSVLGELRLSSEFDWVNKEYDFFSGNIVGHQVSDKNGSLFNVLSIYSPAWCVPWDRLNGIDVSKVKLHNNPDVWCTEIIWSLLCNSLPSLDQNWIMAGDFNCSTTFDWMWGKKPRGNQEIIDRLTNLGLTDCLSFHHGNLVPTFKNTTGGKVIHQLDYVYVNEPLLSRLKYCDTSYSDVVFDQNISDHLPIIAEFSD